MCGGGGGIFSGVKNIVKDIGRVGLNPFDFKAHKRLFSQGTDLFKSVGQTLGLSQPTPEINIPENKGVATENMGTGKTGALVELGANDELKAKRVSGGGSGGRTRSGLSRMSGGSGLGF